MQRRRNGGTSCSRCKSQRRHEKKGSSGRRWKRYSISIELMGLPRLEKMRMGAYSQERREFLKVALAATSLSIAPTFAWALGSEEERTAWYRNAKFGMFIHWGPYSVASVEASWPIMAPTGEISEAEYRALPARFNPVRFD